MELHARFHVSMTKTVALKACTDRRTHGRMNTEGPIVVTSSCAAFSTLGLQWSNNNHKNNNNNNLDDAI